MEPVKEKTNNTVQLRYKILNKRKDGTSGSWTLVMWTLYLFDFITILILRHRKAAFILPGILWGGLMTWIHWNVIGIYFPCLDVKLQVPGQTSSKMLPRMFYFFCNGIFQILYFLDYGKDYISIWASLMSLMQTKRASGVLNYNLGTFDNYSCQKITINVYNTTSLRLINGQKVDIFTESICQRGLCDRVV